MRNVLALGLIRRDALLLGPRVPVIECSRVSRWRGKVGAEEGRKGGKDGPLVLACKVHHAGTGGGVVTDVGLLEETVELERGKSRDRAGGGKGEGQLLAVVRSGGCAREHGGVR